MDFAGSLCEPTVESDLFRSGALLPTAYLWFRPTWVATIIARIIQACPETITVIVTKLSGLVKKVRYCRQNTVVPLIQFHGRRN